MPKGFNPTESESGVTPNRLTRRNHIKNARKEAKASERTPSYLRRPMDLSAVPLWSKILIGGIVFSYCGGMEVLNAVSSYSRGDFQRLIIIVPVVVLFIAGYFYWASKVQDHGAPSATQLARNCDESPFERVHGKWRLKKRGPVAALPVRKTPGQLKERRPSKKYGAEHAEKKQIFIMNTRPQAPLGNAGLDACMDGGEAVTVFSQSARE